MHRRTPTAESVPVIKRPAPANRSHLLKQKATVSATPSPVSALTPRSSIEANKKPLHTAEDNRKQHSDPEEPSPSTRGRRSCKDNASKAWAFLVAQPPKRSHQDSPRDENVGGASRSPSPPKSVNRSRRGRASLSVNTSPRKRNVDIDLQNEASAIDSRPAMKIPKMEKGEYEALPTPSMRIDAENDIPSRPKPVTAGPRQVFRSFSTSPKKQDASQAQATPTARPVKPAQPTPQAKPVEIKRDQPAEIQAKQSASAPKCAQNQSHEFTKIINTLKNEVNRVNEYHRTSVDDLEESYKSIIEMKDRRIRDLEKQLRSVQESLQKTISDHLKYVSGEGSDVELDDSDD